MRYLYTDSIIIKVVVVVVVVRATVTVYNPVLHAISLLKHVDASTAFGWIAAKGLYNKINHQYRYQH